MRFKDVFSIIGPSMIGPSSSHTAGAVRIGRVARQIVGHTPTKVDIYLYGSFAETYHGHGTNLALVAGLLGFQTDDERLREAMHFAKEAGMELQFIIVKQPQPQMHPNTAKLVCEYDNKTVEITGCSIGGGNIEIHKINQYDVKFSAHYPTLLIFHEDRTGVISFITHMLQQFHLNIGFMKVERDSRHGEVLTVIELDNPIASALIPMLQNAPYIQSVIAIDITEGEQR